jgi:hypothetical protein
MWFMSSEDLLIGLPNWTVPRLRLRRSDKLKQHGRCSQVVLLTTDLPWPLSSREVALDVAWVDDIEVTGEIASRAFGTSHVLVGHIHFFFSFFFSFSFFLFLFLFLFLFIFVFLFLFLLLFSVPRRLTNDF